MCTAMGKDPPNFVLVPERDGESRLTADVKAMHYKEFENRHLYVKLRIEMEYEETERWAQDWQEEVEIDAKFHPHCEKFVDMMTAFESM